MSVFVSLKVLHNKMGAVRISDSPHYLCIHFSAQDIWSTLVTVLHDRFSVGPVVLPAVFQVSCCRHLLKYYVLGHQ